MNPLVLCLLLIRNILLICAVIKKKIKGGVTFFCEMVVDGLLVVDALSATGKERVTDEGIC